MLGSSVNNSLYTLNIRLPHPVGTVMRVGDLNTESNTLSANFTLCHGGTSFILEHDYIILSYLSDKCK